MREIPFSFIQFPLWEAGKSYLAEKQNVRVLFCGRCFFVLLFVSVSKNLVSLHDDDAENVCYKCDGDDDSVLGCGNEPADMASVTFGILSRRLCSGNIAFISFHC